MQLLHHDATEHRPLDEAVDVDGLVARFRDRTARVGVIGLGYVGLPLAARSRGAGFPALGFDIDRSQGRTAQRRRLLYQPYRAEEHRRDARGRPSRRDRRFRPAARGRCDHPLRADAADQAPRARPELCRAHHRGDRAASAAAASSSCWNRPPIRAPRARSCGRSSKRSGLRSGRDFFLAYSPEREDPGNADFGTGDIPKVVGGDGAGRAAPRARALRRRSSRAPCRSPRSRRPRRSS